MPVRSRALLLGAAMLAICCLSARPAAAQVFGQYLGADPLAPNQRLFGAYIQSNGDLLGATGQLRLSFSQGMDFGFQAGLTSHHLEGGDRTTLSLGTDLKVAVVTAGGTAPFSIAFDGAVGVENSDQYSVITLQPLGVMSRRYLVGGSTTLAPFLGAGFAFTHSNIEGENQSNLMLPFRLGTEIEVGPQLRFTTELQLLFGNDTGDDYQVVAGANFPF